MTTRAEEDILGAVDRITDPLTASRWFGRLMAHLERLSDSAEWYGLAGEADELGLELRETFFGKKRGRYRILYEIRGNVVRVITDRYGSRGPVTADDL